MNFKDVTVDIRYVHDIDFAYVVVNMDKGRLRITSSVEDNYKDTSFSAHDLKELFHGQSLTGVPDIIELAVEGFRNISLNMLRNSNNSNDRYWSIDGKVFNRCLTLYSGSGTRSNIVLESFHNLKQN